MNFNTAKSEPLLSAQDPSPFEVVRGDSETKVLLVCDHAGQHIPLALQSGAPSSEDMQTHAAYDIGAKRVARKVAHLTKATLVLQRYTRLVIDANRPRCSPQLSPPISDGIVVPFNRNLSDEQLDLRWSEIHQPYHNQIRALLDERAGLPTAFVAIHSFTPQLREGPKRPWHMDLLVRKPSSRFDMVKPSLQAYFPDMEIGIGEVFQVSDDTDYTLTTHAESRGIPHFSVEVRNDMIINETGAERMSHALAGTISKWLAEEFETAPRLQHE